MPELTLQQRYNERLTEGAKRYALANKSDPFALATALAQIKCGIVNSEAMFNADTCKETRELPEGVKLLNGDTAFEVTSYRNLKRP